jgi:hypothetical protein
LLNNVTGDVDLLGSTVSPTFVAGSGAAGCNNPSNVRFFSDQAKTQPTPLGDVFRHYDCTNANSTYPVYVAIGSNPADPLTFSPSVLFQITVLDQTPPTAAAPNNAAVNTAPGVCTATGIAGIGLTLVPKAFPQTLNPGEYTDNCPANLKVTYTLTGATSLGPINGTDAGVQVFNKGITTVTYKILDQKYSGPGSGFITVSCTVTVTDNQPPVINCPSNLNVNTDPGVCTYTYTGANATATDNCAVTSLTNSLTGTSSLSGYAFPSGGTTFVTWTASDGNLSDNCVQQVTVTDIEAPVIDASSCKNVTVNMDPNTCVYLVSGTAFDATATDNCGLQSIINDQNFGSSLDGISFAPIGTYPVTWTAMDIYGNTSTCVMNVTVQDVAAPDIVALFNLTYFTNVTPGDCSAAITFERPNDFAPPTFTPNYSAVDCNTIGGPYEGFAIVNGKVDSFLLNSIIPVLASDPFNRLATVQFPVGTTLIPYIWSDLSGNADTIFIKFVVNENQKPVAKCKPGVITLPLDANGNAVLTVAQVNDGSSDNCGIDTMFVTPSFFQCSDVPALQSVQLKVIDKAQNSQTCTAVVDVVDNIPPAVLCPTNKSATANSGCDATGVAGIGLTQVSNITGPGQFHDNCGVASIGWKLTGATTATGTDFTLTGIPNSQAFHAGTTVVTYTVNGANGNPTVCSFNVNVSDQTGPVFSGGTIPPPQSVSNGCIKQVFWTEPTATDACTPPVTVVKSHAPGSFFFFGTTLVTYTATDGAGNITTYTFNVVVNDTQAPVANCKNVTATLNAGGTASVTAAQIDNNSFDNCTYSYVNTSYNFNCANLGTNIITFTIVDGSGNTGTCTSTVTVTDNIPPVAVCASPGTINLNSGGQATLTAASMNAGSTDNCSASLTYLISVDGGTYASSATFTCSSLAPSPSHIITFKATDGGNNTSTCSRTIIVKDVTAPTFTVPAGITIPCTASALPATTGTVTNVSDACDANPVISSVDAILAGPCANTKTITRTWKVTDASGNFNTATQVISIIDNVAPVFNISSTINLNSTNPVTCTGPLVLKITADSLTDNCTTNFANLNVTYTIKYPTPAYGFTDVTTPTVGKVIPGGAFPIGTTQVVWRGTDECGNTTTATVNITVKDVQGPVFANTYTNCGKHIMLDNTSGACSNVFSWVRPSAIAIPPDVNDCKSFTVTESIDNSTVQQSINSSYPFDYNTTQLFKIFPTAQFPVGITTIKYVATDAVGNTSVCSFTVEVDDTQAPKLTCPGTQILNATCPTAQIPDYRNLVLLTDNCLSTISLTQTYAPQTTLAAIFAPNPPHSSDSFNIKIKAVDGYNSFKADSCTFKVKIIDGQAPIPSIAVLPNIVDSCGGIVINAPVATDACNPNNPIIYGSPSTPVGMFIPGTPPKYNLMPGLYVITWVYNDGNGNISTQAQNITVLADVFPPKALCKPNLTINLDTAGNASITTAQIDNGSFDQNACGAITLSVNPSTVNCSKLGINNVILTVKDLKGNTATCSTPVTVKDVTAPKMSAAPANITVEACAKIPAPPAVTATDICDNTVAPVLTQLSNEDTIGIHKYNYTITRTWVSTDDSGNSASVAQTVTVKDTKAPVFSASTPDTIIVLTDGNALTCSDTVVFNIKPYVTDCATGTDLTITNNINPPLGPNITGIYSVGTYQVIFTATDVTGNSAKDTVVIIVKDKTPPTAVCINGVSAALQPNGNVTVTTAQFNNNSYDNCTPLNQLDQKIQRLDPVGLLTNTITYTCDDADGVTKHPVKLYVRDLEGNVSTCQTYIVIQDNVPPTISSCPPGKTVQCNANLSPSAQGNPTVTDNCTMLNVTFTDVTSAGTGSTCKVVTRTWKAADQANNTVTCVQTFNIQDTIKPSFSIYPASDTISCSDALATPPVVKGLDNCSDTVIVTLKVDTIAISPGKCGQFSYTVRRTWKATDECGNTAQHTQTIKVVDQQAPQFLGLPKDITVNSADYAPNNNCLVPVSLNVGQYLFDCEPDSLISVTNDAPHGLSPLDISGFYAVGTYTVHFTAKDACGNTGKDSVVLHVIDNSIPTAVCNGNVVVSLGSTGTATISANDINLGSSDNCGIDTMYLSQTTFSCAQLGSQPVKLFVVDINGNMNSCTVNVKVELGVNSGFSLTATGSPESYFGADDGKAVATITGGSGNFVYNWNNNLHTATLTGLAAGTYTVTIQDQVNGCVAVDTAIVDEGAKITLNAPVVTGCQNEVVTVPITVDNFFKVNGFTFTMNIADASVGAITGVTNVNPAFTGSSFSSTLLPGNNAGILFTGTGSPITLPAHAKLFDLTVKLGTAPLNSSSNITFGSTPVVLEFNQDSSGVSVIVTQEDINNGSAKITCTAGTAKVTGIVHTWKAPTKPVPGVNAVFTGFPTSVTAANGSYVFAGLPLATNVNISFNKTTAGNDGVTAADLLFITNHIFNNLLPSPYQWVAADANGDGNITLNDYLRIQRVALGTDQHILGSPDWKFVPESYVFPSPNPLSAPYPQTATACCIGGDTILNMIGIRMGDVNGNIVPTLVNDDVQDRSENVFHFQLDDRSFHAGDIVTVPFKASDFTGRQGYQMTIDFDPTIFSLEDIQTGILPNMSSDNFGTAHLADGNLTTLWVYKEPVTLKDGEVLFTLTFRALRNCSAVSAVLHAGSEITKAEAYESDGRIMKVDFNFAQAATGTELAPFALYQNQPNPFNAVTTIGFRLPESSRATLRVYNMSGQLVKTVIGDFDKGYNEVNFRPDDLGKAGVYWYELETPAHSDRKKMILID